MQVQDSAHTFGGHPNQCMQPSPRPYLQTSLHGNWKTHRASFSDTDSAGEGGQRSSPKLEGWCSPLCALHAPASRVHLAAFRCAVCCCARHLIGCCGGRGGRGHQVSSLEQRLPKSQHVGSTARAENGPTTTQQHTSSLLGRRINCVRASDLGWACLFNVLSRRLERHSLRHLSRRTRPISTYG